VQFKDIVIAIRNYKNYVLEEDTAQIDACFANTRNNSTIACWVPQYFQN
jgi:hypothetical protein